MPEMLNVVRLTGPEKEALVEAVKPAQTDAVARELKATLKSGSDAVTAASKAPDLDPASLRAAKAALDARQRLLEALPSGDATKAAIESTATAAMIIDEALSMLDR